VPQPLASFDKALVLPAAARLDRLGAEVDGVSPSLSGRRVGVVWTSESIAMPACVAPHALQHCFQPLKAAVFAGLLRRDVRVVDGGVIQDPEVRVADGKQRWVATVAASGDRTTIEAEESLPEVVEGVGSVDAGSLWGPQLAPVLDLEVLLRVQHVSVVSRDLPADEALEFTRGQLATFNGDAAIWNRDLGAWVQLREAKLDELGRWQDAWNTYESGFDAWKSGNLSNWKRSGRPGAERRPRVVGVPEAPPYASQETLAELVRGPRGVVRRLMGVLAMTALDPVTGQVLWVGRAKGEMAAGEGAEHALVERMLDAIVVPKRP
jgi:hypothetical protein